MVHLMNIMYGAVQSWCSHLCSSRPPSLNEGKKIPESWFAAAPGLVFKMNFKASTAGAFYIELWNIYSWLSQFGCYWKSEALSPAEDGLPDLARADLNNSDSRRWFARADLNNSDNLDTAIRLCWHVSTWIHLAPGTMQACGIVITIIWGQIYLPEAKYISLKPNICTWGLGKRCASSSGESYLLPLPIGTGSLLSGWDEIWGVT